MAESERCVGRDTTVQTRSYVSSLSGDAERLLEAVFADTGDWRTLCIGYWMCPLARTLPE